MVYVYFFNKCVVKWSENSVRFDNLMGIACDHKTNDLPPQISVLDIVIPTLMHFFPTFPFCIKKGELPDVSQ